VELKPGERGIDGTRPERHQLRRDPIVKNVALADILTPALEQDLTALAPAPTLLPGESIERYQLMRQAILSDIAPKSAIEWLLAVDVIELSWEIERYRILRHKSLMQYREQAIEKKPAPDRSARNSIRVRRTRPPANPPQCLVLAKRCRRGA
jgi:hypothetical protein